MNADILKQAVLDAIDIPIFVLDRDLQIVLSNNALTAVCKLYGINPDIVGKPYGEAFPPLIEGTSDRYRRIFETGAADISQHTHEISGRTISLEIMRFPVYEEGRISHVVVVGRDITSTKALEKSLRESEETTRALINASTATMVLTDADGRIITLNELAAARFNLTIEKAIGLSGEDIFPPDLWENRKTFVQQVVETGLPVRFQDRRAGRTMDNRLYPILDSQRRVHRIAIYGLDVTDVEAAMLALRESDETARTLMNASSESIILLNPDETIVALNEIAAQRMGLSVSEAIGRSARTLFPANIAERRSRYFRGILESRTPARFTDVRAGKSFDISMHPIVGSDGTVQRVAVFARDITEYLEAITALRESEATSRALVDASTASIILMHPEGTVITMNEVAATRVNLSVAEAIGRKGSEVFSPEVWQLRAQYIQEVVESHKPKRFTDDRFNKTVEVSLYPILDADGNVQRIAIYATDMTEHLKAMEALRQSEERYRRQFESIPVATYVWEQVGADFELKGFNRAAGEMTSGSIANFVGRLASEMYADRPDIVMDMKSCAASGSPIIREMTYRYQWNNEEKYVQAHFGFVPPNQVLVHAIDQTERRETEVALDLARRTLEGEVEKRTQELAQANEQLNVERQALRDMNIALQKVIEQASRNRDSLADQIQANVEKIILPVLESLSPHLNPAGKKYLELARTSLLDIVSPYVLALESESRKLTSREIELCNLIRQGHSCKEIAALRNTSAQTVLTQRKIIRRKLGLVGKQVNLASYLTSIMSTSRAHDFMEHAE